MSHSGGPAGRPYVASTIGLALACSLFTGPALGSALTPGASVVVIAPDKDGKLDLTGPFDEVARDEATAPPFNASTFRTDAIGSDARGSASLTSGVLRARAYSPDAAGTCDAVLQACEATEATRARSTISDVLTFGSAGTGGTPARVPVTFSIAVDGTFVNGAEGRPLASDEFALNQLNTSLLLTAVDRSEEAQFFMSSSRTSDLANNIEDQIGFDTNGSFGFDTTFGAAPTNTVSDFEAVVRLTADVELGKRYNLAYSLEALANEYGFFRRNCVGPSCPSGTTTDATNTAVLAFALPPDVTFTSASGQFLAENPPQVVPLPAAGWMLAAGLAAFIGLRARASS